MRAKDKVPPKTRRSSKRWTITSGSGSDLLVDGVPIVRDVREACKRLSKDRVIGIDTETTGFSAWRDNIALVQMYGEDSRTCAVLQVKNGVIPEEVKSLFTKDRTFIVHNGVGFDLWFMDTHGIKWERSKWHDTLVGETVLASTGRRDVSKSLRASLRRRIGKEVDKDIEHGHWDGDLTDRQLEYAAQDVLSLPALYREQLAKAEHSEETRAMEMEMELVPYVARMSINGLPLKRKVMEKFVTDQHTAIADAERFLKKRFGSDINLGSPKQLKTALNNNGIAVESTGIDVLSPLLMVDGPHTKIIEPLIAWKHGAQRIKMYSESWMDQHIIDDWVHPHFWQCSADTTRFTSSDPNLQQVPKDSRGIIGGADGIDIVSVDYSQIEVRIAAKVAQDDVLIAALESEDIHTTIAAEVYNIPESEVSKYQRKVAKAMTFLLLFGGGVPRFYEYVKMLGGSITYDESSELVFKFFSKFTGLHAMKKKAERLAMKPGPAFIRLPNSNRRILIGQNKRSTVILNTMVQGTAAVGLKYGIIEAGRRGLMEYVGATVHDELVAAVPHKMSREFGRELQEAMVVGMKKAIDITVRAEVSIGKVWQA